MSMRTAWDQMIGRCYDPSHHKYHLYGARGIKVCERWRTFSLFLQDMGKRPTGKTLNRKDNNGDYCPENCEWATYEEQNRNRRDNRNITFDGRTMCLTEWALITRIKRTTLRKRLDKGWSVQRALTGRRYERVA